MEIHQKIHCTVPLFHRRDGSLRFYLGSSGLLNLCLRPQDQDLWLFLEPTVLIVWCPTGFCLFGSGFWNNFSGLDFNAGSWRLEAFYFEASESVMRHLKQHLFRTGREAFQKELDVGDVGLFNLSLFVFVHVGTSSVGFKKILWNMKKHLVCFWLASGKRFAMIFIYSFSEILGAKETVLTWGCSSAAKHHGRGGSKVQWSRVSK